MEQRYQTTIGVPNQTSLVHFFNCHHILQNKIKHIQGREQQNQSAKLEQEKKNVYGKI